MENKYSRLRSTAFGGFKKQDVIEYIEKIKNEAFEEKVRAEKKVRELEEKIAELESVTSDFETEKEKLMKHIGELSVVADSGKNGTADEINEATNHLKNVADELCESLREFMERISENSYSVVIEGSDRGPEEDFDGEKFMAELEAEIYAKLGVDDSVEDEEVEACQECTPDEDKCDEKVNSILSSLSAFAPDNGDRIADIEKTENKKDETVSNILGSLSFLK